MNIGFIWVSSGFQGFQYVGSIVWEYNIWNPLRGSRRVALRVWTGLDKTGPSYVSTL